MLVKGTAIIALNGKKVLIRDCLHVPDLRNPLYSLRAHQRQRGCGFIGLHGHGVYVFFPHFILEVDTSTDCHLRYQALGRTCGLPEVDYVQPKRPLIVGEHTASEAAKTPTLPPPLMPTFASHNPKQPPRPPSPQPNIDIDHLQSQIKDYTVSLKDMSREELVEKLYTFEHPPATPPSPKTLLSTMSKDEIAEHLHHPDSSMLPIRPCDTPNGSDTKTHYSGEELHRVTGCRKLRNYKHLMLASKDGQFIEGGEFPTSIGGYTTIPKAPRGSSIDRTKYKYLDIVHMDIAFGDCMAVGGARYALILVDRATRYNWVFSLKSLSSADIITALKLFRAEAGRLATEFRCDCDEKLFGSAIRSFLHDAQSKVAAAPAGRQSANGLVESHWKIMVHMSRAYLTEKQMPRAFWYQAVKHAARMMNMIPGKYKTKLASPFMLVHGECPDQRTWIPIFSLCYFHHDKDGDTSRSKNQAHTMDGIVIGRSPTSNALLVYNPRNKRYYEPDSYKLDPYRLPTSVYPTIKYDGGLFCSLLRDENPAMEEPYPPGTRIEDVDALTKVTQSGTVMDVPFQIRNLRTILFSSMMVLPSQCQRQLCPPLSPSLLNQKWIMMNHYSHPSFVQTAKSPTNMKANITKDI